jgi:malonyl-CoA O-methyltransferase
MEARLEWIVKKPSEWLHWEPLQGGFQAHTLLTKRYPKSKAYVLESGVEKAQAAHKKIVNPWWSAGIWSTPKTLFSAPEKPVQMLWANMALHMAADPQALIAQWHSLLEVDGFLMFSCLGPDTLRELRPLYAEFGWPPPTHTFTDMHDWGDMLVGQGFAEPVMDMERITLSFSTPETLLAELRGLGRNLHAGRFAGLRGRGWLAKLHHELAQRGTKTPDGRLQLSFEVIYGHAFKPPVRLGVVPETRVTLDEMRKALRQRK